MDSNFDENDICDLDDLLDYYRIDDKDLIQLDRDDECYKFEEEILNNSEEY